MRRGIAWVIACLFLLTAALPGLAGSFSDTAGHWAEPSIQEAADRGLIGGNPDGSFRPDDPLTRAAFVTLISKALQLPPTMPAAPTFADTAGHWVVAQGYLEAAVKAGIVRAADYGTAFEPDRPIPREEIAVMAVRALGLDDWSQQPTGTDAGAITAPRRAQVAAAQDLGVVTGFPDGSFQPQSTATRAQAAVIILRVAERLDRLAEPAIPAGLEELCAGAPTVVPSSDDTTQLLKETAAALGISLSSVAPGPSPVCSGSDNPGLKLVQLIIDEARAAGAAGDLNRAERLRAEGLRLLRSVTPTLGESHGAALVMAMGPKLAASTSGPRPRPEKGRLEQPQTVNDHITAAQQARELGDDVLVDQELQNAGRAHREWAQEQLKDLRKKARSGEFDQLDVNDVANIWYDAWLFKNDELFQNAQDVMRQMLQQQLRKAAESAACPPTDAEMNKIIDLAHQTRRLTEDQASTQEIFNLVQAKMEQAIRQAAQTGDGGGELGRMASLWGLEQVASELMQGKVKPPRCEVTWSGTVTVVRTVQYHRFSSSPEEGTETADFQATHKFTLKLDKGEESWSSEVKGSGSGTWVLHEDSPECGPSVVQTDTSYTIGGMGGAPRPVNLSLVVQEDGHYTIAFSVPAPFAMIEGRTAYQETGGCFPDSQEDAFSIPLDETELMPGYDVRIEEDAGKPNPGYLKGSTIRIQPIDGGQIKDEIEWELLRVKPA